MNNYPVRRDLMDIVISDGQPHLQVLNPNISAECAVVFYSSSGDFGTMAVAVTVFVCSIRIQFVLLPCDYHR